MSENIRAQKLAAARKKLKEYQSKDKQESSVPKIADFQKSQESEIKSLPPQMTPPPFHEENVENSIICVENTSSNNVENTSVPIELVSEYSGIPTTEEPSMLSNYFTQQGDGTDTFNATHSKLSDKSEVDVIQMLITEKAAISSELIKFRTISKEREMEMEELSARYNMINRRMEDLERGYLEQQKQNETLKLAVNDLQSELLESKSNYSDQTDHVQELKHELSNKKLKYQEMEANLKQAMNELEMNKIRINQISDEACISTDNRVESLTQTKFMYEQQIRDLQAMVQQLSADKEQANQQYQSYVQHLNNEMTALSEKNSETLDENAKLQSREKELIDHIGGLEKQIQLTLARQEQLRDIQCTESDKQTDTTIVELKAKLEQLESERLEFQLKIKSQDDQLKEMEKIKNENDSHMEELEKQNESIASNWPDADKLLATMESDKIAASRALFQNEELKKQLDELQLKFVQLTNDKVELTNQLDSEGHANREMRQNYVVIDEKLKNLTEQLHFKDEEMIRLSHENNELKLTNFEVQQKVNRLKHFDEEEKPDSNHHHHSHNHHHHHHDDDTPCDEENIEKSENLDNSNGNGNSNSETDSITSPETIPSTEAAQKLQTRFTKLMRQVADLTDEKQRLEHLVMQLQDETETIGEYISLYQTQRRILKQREYEQTAQLQRLLSEREEMKGKISALNELINNLGIPLPNTAAPSNEIDFAVEASPNDKSNCIEDLQAKLNSTASKEIITEIQNIIMEIKENTKDVPSITPAVDHCSCCSGKFETV